MKGNTLSARNSTTRERMPVIKREKRTNGSNVKESNVKERSKKGKKLREKLREKKLNPLLQFTLLHLTLVTSPAVVHE